MADLDNSRDRHPLRFALAAGGLVFIGIGLMFSLVFALWSMPTSDAGAIDLLMHVAWLSMVLLFGVLILLAWTVMRYLRLRLLGDRMPPATQHPDAWAVAGERISLNGNHNSSGEWRDDTPDDEEDDTDEDGL